MTLTLQFVDSIASSPAVLFDLNDLSLTFVTQNGWSAPPPALQRSASSSSAYDGSNVSQSSYMDREITVTVAIKSASQDASATAIQAIGRLLNSDGQWLKLSTGTTNPVFFRTKRAEIEQLEEFNGQSDGFRTATLTIPAEPFAYGLQESGSATVANDPTAGTNPMSYVFPTVKGDVATPLVLQAVGIAGGMLSMCASPSAPSVPLLAQTPTLGSASGWSSATGTVDSNAIGGTATTLTKASGSAAFPFSLSPAAVPLGDWRLLLRVATGTSGVTFTASVGGKGAVTRAIPAIAVGSYNLVDFGVFRMPISPIPSTPPGIATPSPIATQVDFLASIVGATGAVRVDALICVPAGLDDAALSRLMIGGGDSAVANAVNVDSIGQTVWLASTNALVSIAGDFPALQPGFKNLLTLASILSSNTIVPHTLTGNVALSWLYYPRYLYVRPATT